MSRLSEKVGNVSNFIYRYKYFSDSQWLRETISERTIKFTNPHKFNDPFDCMPAFEVRYSRDISRFHPKIRSMLNLDGLTGVELEEKISMSELHIAQVIGSGEFLSGLLSGTSVLSLSKIPDSTLMWSHYAQNHSGVVLEFKIDISDEEFSFDDSYSKFICQDVEYVDARPLMLVDGSPSNPETIIGEIFLAKSGVWSYEQESRVLKNTGGEGVFKYDDSLLSSVILGARNASENEIRELVAVTGKELGREIPVYKTDFCKRNYRVVIPDFTFRFEEGDIQSDYPAGR